MITIACEPVGSVRIHEIRRVLAPVTMVECRTSNR